MNAMTRGWMHVEKKKKIILGKMALCPSKSADSVTFDVSQYIEYRNIFALQIYCKPWIAHNLFRLLAFWRTNFLLVVDLVHLMPQLPFFPKAIRLRFFGEHIT
jgi:hypothetical protein